MYKSHIPIYVDIHEYIEKWDTHRQKVPPARLTVDELGNNRHAHCFSVTRLTAKESLDGQKCPPIC